MKFVNSYGGQNWLITPAALAVNERAPAIGDQRLLLVLTGVLICDVRGNSGAQWLRETLEFIPDMAGPLNWAISRWSLPRPPVGAPNHYVGFALEEWAPFAAPSSMFNQNTAVNSGHAVDTWRPSPFASGTDARTNQPVSRVFNGVRIDVAVRDTDAFLHRVSYHVSLLGRIVFPVNVIL